MSVDRATKGRIVEFLAPAFLAVGFVVKMAYKIVFAWWLDPLSQLRENRALWNEVQANFHFLTSQAQADFSGPTKIHPFDYASVKIPWKNLFVTITKRRGDTTVCVAPRHSPARNYELGPLIAALERRHLSEGDIVNDLAGAASLLRPRLEQLNRAFSEEEFQRTKQLL